MRGKETLHILNGQAMYNFFKETDFLKGETMVPFNEAMCFGGTCKDLFSQEFVDMRAEVHHVTAEQYTEHTLKPLQPLFDQEFTKLALWLDADMFCQINLLTILAWLDSVGYKEVIDIHIVGDRFKPESQFSVQAKGYDSVYKQVLLEKTMPEDVHNQPALLQKGMELYLNYLQADSDLMHYIQAHQDDSEEELVYKLINQFRDYGLGDTQYLEIIRTQRGSIY